MLGFDLMEEEVQAESVFYRFTDITKDSEYAQYIQVLLTKEIRTKCQSLIQLKNDSELNE